jgi:hypothetical protein
MVSSQRVMLSSFGVKGPAGGGAGTGFANLASSLQMADSNTRSEAISAVDRASGRKDERKQVCLGQRR